MPLILRAIITGFGYKVGTELAKFVVDRVAGRKKGKKPEAEATSDDGLPEGMPSDPANPGVEAPARPQPN